MVFPDHAKKLGFHSTCNVKLLWWHISFHLHFRKVMHLPGLTMGCREESKNGGAKTMQASCDTVLDREIST